MSLTSAELLTEELRPYQREEKKDDSIPAHCMKHLPLLHDQNLPALEVCELNFLTVFSHGEHTGLKRKELAMQSVSNLTETADSQF